MDSSKPHFLVIRPDIGTRRQRSRCACTTTFLLITIIVPLVLTYAGKFDNFLREFTLTHHITIQPRSRGQCLPRRYSLDTVASASGGLQVPTSRLLSVVGIFITPVLRFILVRFDTPESCPTLEGQSSVGGDA